MMLEGPTNHFLLTLSHFVQAQNFEDLVVVDQVIYPPSTWSWYWTTHEEMVLSPK